MQIRFLQVEESVHPPCGGAQLNGKLPGRQA